LFRKLQNYIEEQKFQFVEKKKEATSKVAAAKKMVIIKNCDIYYVVCINVDCFFCYIVFMVLCTCYLQEKSLKQKLKDEKAKAIRLDMGSLTIRQHDVLLSEIESQAAEAHSKVLEAKHALPERKL
jgi:hypothetical protein